MPTKPLIDEESREKARLEAEIEGVIQARQEVLMEYLSEMGDVSDELKEAIIEQRDLDVLRWWNACARNVKTVDEFVGKLRIDYAIKLTNELSEKDFLRVLELIEFLKEKSEKKPRITEENKV